LSQVIHLVDPVTREVSRSYADGAAFVAYGHPHPLGFWSRHPDVERFEEGEAGAEAEAGDVAVRVWLRQGRIQDNSETPPSGKPAHGPDLAFSGPGRMGDAFWERHPDIAHALVFNHLGDDSFDQDCWLVKVWLKGGD
jgi:hypothetical protein